jgi:citrate lyase subunit beta/citryl-CoA lyase
MAGEPGGERPVRLQRSFLAVPGSRPDFFEKALRGPADAVFLDLEDGVAPEDKPIARRNVIRALHDLDWRGAGKTITLRINVLGGPYAHRDLVEVVEAAADRIDTVLVPKVDGPGDVRALDLFLTGIEAAAGAGRRIGIEALVESAPGLASVNAIAAASPRLEALHVGPGDLAASLGARTIGIGVPSPDYPGDQWHAALSGILVAARAHGLRAIDGTFDDFGHPEGFLASARRSAALGYDGKWTIHPSQVPLANEVYSPSEAEVAGARGVLAALEEAFAAGRGAVRYEGRMIDAASARLAQNLVALADRIAARDR